MAIGDMLNWAACPPAIRRHIRTSVLATLLVSAAGIALVIFRDRLGIPREPWGRYGPLALALIPFTVIWPLFLLSRRRIHRAFRNARGRLCTHCTYNLTAMNDQGTCPECGNRFDAKADAEMWKTAGFKCEH